MSSMRTAFKSQQVIQIVEKDTSQAFKRTRTLSQVSMPREYLIYPIITYRAADKMLFTTTIERFGTFNPCLQYSCKIAYAIYFRNIYFFKIGHSNHRRKSKLWFSVVVPIMHMVTYAPRVKAELIVRSCYRFVYCVTYLFFITYSQN